MIARIALLFLLLLLNRPAHTQDAPIDPVSTFHEFWSLYNDNYALFGIKRVEWNAIRSIYEKRILTSSTRAELFQVFSEATGLLNDVHVSVRDERTGSFFRSGGRSIGTGEFQNGEFSLELIASHYAATALTSRAGGTMLFGELRSGAGYLRLDRFKHPSATEQAIDEVLAAIPSFANPHALIIDVRHNGGGTDAVGRLIANRFADRRRHYMSVSNRRPGMHPALYCAPLEWHVEPQPDHRFEGRIIVLTNSRTISAAENFVLAMRTIPGVIIVGDVTAGAMADTVVWPIADGWTFTVPINIVRDAQGVCWEGVGLAPDLWIRNTPSEISAGRDRVLDLAIHLAGIRQ